MRFLIHWVLGFRGISKFNCWFSQEVSGVSKWALEVPENLVSLMGKGFKQRTKGMAWG